MEAAAPCFCCGSVSVSATLALKQSLTVRSAPNNVQLHPPSICLQMHKGRLSIIHYRMSDASDTGITQRRTRSRSRIPKKKPTLDPTPTSGEGDNPKKKKKKKDAAAAVEAGTVSVGALHQNGDPLGRRELGKSVVRWICQAMRAMASDFAAAEVQGEFSELRQRMGPGLTFVIQAQPYLNAIPMPLGLEAICLKACTHYPTLFDHFQRELRDVLQGLERQSVVPNWCGTESWKLLKELASSGCSLNSPYLPLPSSFSISPFLLGLLVLHH